MYDKRIFPYNLPRFSDEARSMIVWKLATEDDPSIDAVGRDIDEIVQTCDDKVVAGPRVGYAQKVAGLILPDTAFNTTSSRGAFHCSKCGFNAMFLNPRYCPQCGALVIEDIFSFYKEDL